MGKNFPGVEMKDSCHISGSETENYATIVFVLVKAVSLFQFIDELLFGPVKLCCLFSYVIWLATTYHPPFQGTRLNHIKLLFNYTPVVWLHMITPLNSFVLTINDRIFSYFMYRF